MPAVSVTVSAVLGTIVTVLAANVSLSAVAASLVFGTVLTVQNVTNMSSLVTIVNLPYVTTAVPIQSSTGLVVIAKNVSQVPFQIIVTSTVVGASTTLLMTVYTANTLATAGASFFVGGSRLRINNMYVVAVSSVVASQANLALLYGTAAASLSVTATVGIGAQLVYFPGATGQFQLQGVAIDGPVAATSIALGLIQGASHTIQGFVITGILF
jgi:hypothetical protein